MSSLTVFAMSKKGLAVVESLIDSAPGLVRRVVVASDTSVANDYRAEIVEACERAGILVVDRSEHDTIDTEYALAVSWRWMLPEQDCRIIVFHDSVLPRYRGFNPLVTALVNGDTQVGVTALYAGREYDRGDVIAQVTTEIEYPITIRQAIDVITLDYARLAELVARQLVSGLEPPATPQVEEGASYSLWRDEEDYLIDWDASATEVRRFVDATGFPYRGASSYLGERKVRILRVVERADVGIANRQPGKVIFIDDGRPVVVCGSGLVEVVRGEYDDDGSSLVPVSAFRLRFVGARSVGWRRRPADGS